MKTITRALCAACLLLTACASETAPTDAVDCPGPDCECTGTSCACPTALVCNLDCSRLDGSACQLGCADGNV